MRRCDGRFRIGTDIHTHERTGEQANEQTDGDRLALKMLSNITWAWTLRIANR